MGARLEHFEELLDELHTAAAAGSPTRTLESALAEHGSAMGVLRSVREVADSDWAREREAIVAVPDRGGGSIRIPNSPGSSATRTPAFADNRYRGEHNREVLCELCGLDGDELDALEAAGVISSRLPGRRDRNGGRCCTSRSNR